MCHTARGQAKAGGVTPHSSLCTSLMMSWYPPPLSGTTATIATYSCLSLPTVSTNELVVDWLKASRTNAAKYMGWSSERLKASAEVDIAETLCGAPQPARCRVSTFVFRQRNAEECTESYSRTRWTNCPGNYKLKLKSINSSNCTRVRIQRALQKC